MRPPDHKVQTPPVGKTDRVEAPRKDSDSDNVPWRIQGHQRGGTGKAHDGKTRRGDLIFYDSKWRNNIFVEGRGRD